MSEPDVESALGRFGATALRIKVERDELLAALRDVLRIAQAMSMSTGVGKGQRLVAKHDA